MTTAASASKSVLGFATIEDPNAPNNEDESGNQVITVEDSKGLFNEGIHHILSSDGLISIWYS